jgi:hypothetical protein
MDGGVRIGADSGVDHADVEFPILGRGVLVTAQTGSGDQLIDKARNVR